MADIGETLLPASKAKKKILTGTVKSLRAMAATAEEIIRKDQGDRRADEISMILCTFCETLLKAEAQVDKYATLVHEYCPLKKTEKEGERSKGK